MGSEFLEFGFEELGLLAGGCFLIEDEDIADIIGVDLNIVSKIVKKNQMHNSPSPSNPSAPAAALS